MVRCPANTLPTEVSMGSESIGRLYKNINEHNVKQALCVFGIHVIDIKGTFTITRMCNFWAVPPV